MAPFNAIVSNAPAEGASLKETVTLEVSGSSLGNVELLPPEGYIPKLGVFTVSPDKTSARLDFDTRSLPNGILLARISAFDKPPGDPNAREAIAMPARKWVLRNNPEPVVQQIPPPSYMPEVDISFLNLPYVDPQPLQDLLKLDDAALGAMLANDWPSVESILLRYIPAHVELYHPTPLSFYNAWYACLRVHTAAACREAIGSMNGLMQGKKR